MEDSNKGRRRWSRDETILALYLYFQLPFGKLHSGNPEIQNLATALGRSNDSVAMKLCNFASLDPKIIASGRKGLAGASQLDRTTYAEFADDWSGLVKQAQSLWSSLVDEDTDQDDESNLLNEPQNAYKFAKYEGPSFAQSMVTTRLGQGFFRRSVLANFEGTCCITGIADSRLLVASHIRPWGIDLENRHNPANGLLLCATLDRAFDRGLLTVTDTYEVEISCLLLNSHSHETRDYFQKYQGNSLRPAKRFDPSPEFLTWHRTNCFIDSEVMASENQ